MSAYTPGPWTYDEESAAINADAKYATRSLRAVAQIEPRMNFGEDSANARLIAAAPDLLDALNEIAHAATIGGISAGERKGLARAAAIARAAIAKATA